MIGGYVEKNVRNPDPAQRWSNRGWSDAQGHATLFDGSSCYDHCYFNEPEARYRTDYANFWSLP